MFYKKPNKLIDPAKTDKELKENPLEFEKGDKTAVIFAAFLAYGPILLILMAILLVAILLLR